MQNGRFLLQMAVDLDLDLTFLDSMDKSIDVFADRLFRIRFLVMDNNDPDIRVIEVLGDEGVQDYIQKLVAHEDSVKQCIVRNEKPLNADFNLLTHYKLIAVESQNSSATNYKFEHFMANTGIHGLSARCRLAVVIGLFGASGNVHVSIPRVYETTDVKNISIYDAIDVYSNRTSENLLGTGMKLPQFIPESLQWKILGYCQSPTARIMRDELDRVNAKFCGLFADLFEVVSD